MSSDTVPDYRTSMSLHDFEMEVTYDDECKEALGDSVRQEDEEIKDTSVFCARGEKKRGGVGGLQFGPCDVSINITPYTYGCE